MLPCKPETLYLQDSWHFAWMSTEAFLFDRLQSALASDPMIVPRLRRQPVLAGINGASMADYASAGYTGPETPCGG